MNPVTAAKRAAVMDVSEVSTVSRTQPSCPESVVHFPVVSAPVSAASRVQAPIVRETAAAEDEQRLRESGVIIMATSFYFSKLAVS